MQAYVQVIIDISQRRLDHPFTYRIPERLSGQVRLGSMVEVPFGKGNTLRRGYVIGFADESDIPDERMKEISGIARKGEDETGGNAIRLAVWMQEQYGGTRSSALKTVLTGRREVRPVERKSVTLLLTEEAAQEKLHLYERKHQTARARLLGSLLQTPTQPYELITQKLHVSAATLKALQQQGVLRIDSRTCLRNPVRVKDDGAPALTLSPQQQAIVDGVLEDYRRARAGSGGPDAAGRDNEDFHRISLIHGITGSGKTEVYISIIERIVAEGRQAIMLIPEIALTYQTLLRFYRHFGDRVSVMNSSLSEGEKSDQFERARRGEIDVIIGPRSALFTPFPSIGVIVLDEEHESSYKNETMPKYHAREVAARIARMHGGVVVLGSATPSIDSYDRARRGEYRLYTLSRRLTGGTLPDVEVADLREELREGNRSILSRRLTELLEDRLERGEQTMLFLNRRGFSGFISCRSCGSVPKCPHCSVALSLHRAKATLRPAGRTVHMAGGADRGLLVCHYCGYTSPAPGKCPECGSPHISGFHAGTEQVETLLRGRYPGARILRMDADTTGRKGGYEKILTSFANREADILIGTQMIVKGHDFPGVTLMGILLADMSLHTGDYRAAERSFQLLTQAAGRAGRGRRPGKVVIQTYEPGHYSIVHAARQDYEGFYQEEIRYRRLLRYPPADHMLAVQIISGSEDHAQLFAGRTRELLDRYTGAWREDGELLIIGPAQAALEKLRDEYRYVLYIKSGQYDKLKSCKCVIEEAAARAVAADPETDTRFQFDFDPVNSF